MVVITLIGTRAVGKSTLTKKLAKILNYEYVDVDREFELYLKDEGGIGGYSSKYGYEKYIEKLYVFFKENICKLFDKNIIIDSGGGTTNSGFKESVEMARILREKSDLIVLILPTDDDEKNIEVLYKREKQRINEFKDYFLKDYSDEKIRQTIADTYYSRTHGFKKQCDFIAYNEDLDNACDSIILELKKREII